MLPDSICMKRESWFSKNVNVSTISTVFAIIVKAYDTKFNVLFYSDPLAYSKRNISCIALSCFALVILMRALFSGRTSGIDCLCA